MDGTNIGPYWPPLPIPIPSVSKRLLPGSKKVEKKHILEDFLLFKCKKIKQNMDVSLVPSLQSPV